MTKHMTEHIREWLAARVSCSRRRRISHGAATGAGAAAQALPWVRIDKRVSIETDEGSARCKTSSEARSQLLVYSLHVRAHYKAGCAPARRSPTGSMASPSTSRTTTSCFRLCRGCRSRSCRAYKRRDGWTFPWASSFGGDFNADFKRRSPRRTAPKDIDTLRTHGTRMDARGRPQPGLQERGHGRNDVATYRRGPA